MSRVGRLLVLVVWATAMSSTAAIAQAPPPQVNQLARALPSVSKNAVALADGTLRTTVQRLAKGKPAPSGVDIVGERVRVEALVSPGEQSDAAAAVERLGGRVEGSTPGMTLQALVPADRLVALERSGAVRFVRPPLAANLPEGQLGDDAAPAPQISGEEVAKTRANVWHDAGITGTGVRIGIVDNFNGAKWKAARDAGEVPEPAGTFCQHGVTTCDVFGSESGHGVAVAEVIAEMAPDAKIYLAQTGSAADLQAAVDYFAAQGVTIVSRSQSADYDGPGDGTGPIDAVIDDAVAKGMTWFNSAGNSAGRGSSRGSYWRGRFADANHNGYIEFAPNDEVMTLQCGTLNGLRWSDWGAGKTDYDVFVYDDPGQTVLKASGVVKQGRADGAPPLEHPRLRCASGSDLDYLVVRVSSPGAGTEGDVLELLGNGTFLEHWVTPFSASGPASDSASPGALSIGAVDPAVGTEIAPYSAAGPTNDNRVKPDLSAAACVASFTFQPDCFNGTSSATPVTSGAAALVASSGIATTPAAVKSYLLEQAAVDRGAPGPDNDFGAGELVLPDPPQLLLPLPSPPIDLHAVAGVVSSVISIVVDWTPRPASPPIREYRIYRDGSRIGTSTLNDTDRQSVRYTDAAITPGETYRYRVRTVNTDGVVSALSAAVRVKAPVDTRRCGRSRSIRSPRHGGLHGCRRS